MDFVAKLVSLVIPVTLTLLIIWQGIIVTNPRVIKTKTKRERTQFWNKIGIHINRNHY